MHIIEQVTVTTRTTRAYYYYYSVLQRITTRTYKHHATVNIHTSVLQRYTKQDALTAMLSYALYLALLLFCKSL